MSDIADEIEKLKKKRNAVVLAHNYQPPEVQDIADYLGDSLGLSRKAAETDADVIVFCGVDFMAETAVILSPDKKVIVPDRQATCPMSEMITAEKLRKVKDQHPDAVVVCYVNTTAAVKAESDICCTSANAVKVVESIPEGEEIIFVPDKYLADYVSRKTGRELLAWDGFCPTHAGITAGAVLAQKRKHPAAKVVVHPECIPEVIDLADSVESTDGMLRYAKESNASEFIVGTEVGMLYRLGKENPEKRFYPASEAAVCPNMKLLNLEKIKSSLEELKYEVRVPADISRRAKNAVDRMLETV